MGFTWIHLNQVNVGTNVAFSHTSYQQWYELAHAQQLTRVPSTRSDVLKKKKDLMATATRMEEKALPLHVVGLPKHTKIRQFPPSKPACPESLELSALRHPPTEALNNHVGRQYIISNEWQPVLGASLALTQADLP